MRNISAINLVAKENMELIANTTTGMLHRVIANRHLVLSAKKKQNTKEDKGKSMMHVLYILQLVKRNIFG